MFTYCCFVHAVGLIGGGITGCYEAKWKMKHPSSYVDRSVFDDDDDIDWCFTATFVHLVG